MIRNIELSALMQTLIAAEQRSFHKAGALLGVRHSTLSRRVRNLEVLVGVKVFERHRHGIRPTVAGEAFLTSIRRVLDDLNAVLSNAHAAGRGEAGWLRIGTYVSPSTGHLRAVLREYKRAFPDVDVQYIEGKRHDLIERLNAGAIDVAIVADHFRNGGHDVIPLWREKILVAMPASHRLAEKPDLVWDDLRQEQIFVGRGSGLELRDHLVAKLKATGDIPSIRQFDIGHEFTVSLVGIERDMTLLYEADAGARIPGVVYREVTERRGPSLLPYYACSLPTNDNPELQRFLDLIRTHKTPYHPRDGHAV